ncbi:unnamed protein product [Brachionus calyciflorus]|uniref:DOMON domain-containing protein n=1 Tax=Brachionus calyciflorus TaxID=104777 RepID=A0A814GTH3_9BILA|nr:unnamed protein product [Brachionus calyciflorus]
MENLRPSEEYKFSLNVDDIDQSLFKIFWKPIENDEIQFELHCRATGWIGFGLSPNGGMAGSDIAIGWVDSNGQSYLKDTYATSKSTPLVDDEQNWDLLDASEQDGYTILKIKRKLITCDQGNDYDIKLETQRLIFAWSDQDPETGDNDWSYHGANRKIKSAILLNFQDETSQIPDSEINDVHEIHLNNHPIPYKDTYYYCKLFSLPPLERDLHLLSYDILIDKESLDFVHHLVVYICKPEDLEKINKISNLGYECGPGGIEEFELNALKGVCEARTLIVSWAVGGQTNISLPENTGFRFPKSDRETLVFVDFHFDNSRLLKNRNVNTGFRFKFTRNLKKYDLGVLAMSVRTNPLDITIPPNTDLIKMSSVCFSDCTQTFLPEDGITVFGGNFHTHLAGRALRTHLIRDGKLVKYLFDDQHYDFNYQSNILIQPTKLMKGDALILDCVYNSTNIRNNTKILVNHLKTKVKSSKELSNRYKHYYANPTNVSAYCSIKTRKNGLFFEKELLRPKENLIEENYCDRF